MKQSLKLWRYIYGYNSQEIARKEKPDAEKVDKEPRDMDTSK